MIDSQEAPPKFAAERTGDKILERSVQSSLSSLAASSTSPPAVWGLIARLNIALGYPAAAKEALRKQVSTLLLESLRMNLLSHLQSNCPRQSSQSLCIPV